MTIVDTLFNNTEIPQTGGVSWYPISATMLLKLLGLLLESLIMSSVVFIAFFCLWVVAS